MYIALGSNIDAERNLRLCAHRMREEWSGASFSHVFRTEPQGFINQDDFLNAVAEIETDLSAKELRMKLVTIEQDFQKNVPYKDGPRTLDLDILLYENDVVQTEELTVPHPRMHMRRFVLEPLVELIGGEEKHPSSQETWNALLAKTMDQKCELTAVQL